MTAADQEYPGRNPTMRRRRDATDKLVLKRLSGPVQVLCGLLAPLVLAQVLASGTLHQRRGQAR